MWIAGVHVNSDVDITNAPVVVFHFDEESPLADSAHFLSFSKPFATGYCMVLKPLINTINCINNAAMHRKRRNAPGPHTDAPRRARVRSAASFAECACANDPCN